MTSDSANTNASAEPPLPSARVLVAVVTLLLQGFAPFAFAEGHPEVVTALVVNAILCVGMAWALWNGWRWALWSALAFVAAQVPVVSTPFCAWEVYLGARSGFGIIPRLNLLDAPLFTFHSVGWAFIRTVWQPSSVLLAEFHPLDGEQTFVAVNFTALLVLLPLIAVKRKQDRQKRPTPAAPNPALAQAARSE